MEWKVLYTFIHTYTHGNKNKKFTEKSPSEYNRG